MADMRGSSPFLKGLFLKNPILVRAIGVGPVVGAAITLKHGLSLSVIMTMLMFGSCLFGFFIGRLISERFRAPLNIVFSAALLIPSYFVADLIFPGSVISLSVFAPLLMVNSILASYVSNTTGGNLFSKMEDVLGNALGFAVITLIIASVREVLSLGTIFGKTVQTGFTMPAINLPFAGFILLGLTAALLKNMRIKYAKRARKGGESR